MESQQRVCALGIHGETGDYLAPPMDAAAFAEGIIHSERNPQIEEFQKLKRFRRKKHLGFLPGNNPWDLGETGWGIVFCHDVDPEIKKALAPLMTWRREQAGDLYREFELLESPSQAGCYENKKEFLSRHKAYRHGLIDPRIMPYYLLVVAATGRIPFRFVFDLDVQYALGLLNLDTREAYASYAETVVSEEKKRRHRNGKLAFFAPAHQDDITETTARLLAAPLASAVAAENSDRQIQRFLEQEADRQNLAKLLGLGQRPDLLFTVSHGLFFPHGHAAQRRHQGALLCADWPGSKVPPAAEHTLSGIDIPDEADVRGMISVHFACFSAGTPFRESFARYYKREAMVLADPPFVADLPKRLLGHPNGTALAVVGHVEGVWCHSFQIPGQPPSVDLYKNLISLLLKGYPIGSACELLGQRYADLATELNGLIDDVHWGMKLDPQELVEMWLHHHDARNFIVLGDPAVTLADIV